ncbi:class I SAM-dependent methyltransferase [Paucilactobacillus wasatchensis]|uniref:Ribosomal RNA small subunit methyltransferase C n=1 Tax=Paucilactobacillus wasatchensis TaxID=1335616 RepID=A0A0D0Y4Q0_9LACO|nr:class I SAM-dependent methyltransferase [Paucilactobacillus wasatchensis]KIS03263.1 Ribosomal RNA small subunit methyltransferase C [Paucilactobacillus wasatchensis]
MNNHYYTQNPDVLHEKKQWQFNLRDQEMQFVTDNGVFSKHSVDFGSRTLIESFALQDLPTGDLLDLGCGYGPIGLAVAKTIGADRHVDMVDVNELALSLARENAQLNQIENVDIFTSDGYANVPSQYAAILTNPPVRAGKQVVDNFIATAKQHLVGNGELWVVLQKKQGAPSAKKLMSAVFGNCEVVQRNKGYYILRSSNIEAD